MSDRLEEIRKRCDAATPTLSAELIENLADAEHASWSRWMMWQFSCMVKQPDGSMLMPAYNVERWNRQAATEYAELSENEKQSDRDEVERIAPYIIDEIKNSRGDIPYLLSELEKAKASDVLKDKALESACKHIEISNNKLFNRKTTFRENVPQYWLDKAKGI